MSCPLRSPVQISVKADRRTRIRILSHSEEARCVCLAAGGRIQKSPAVKVCTVWLITWTLLPERT